MSQAFKSHLEAIEPGSASEAALVAASSSAETLLSYSQARGLDLSPADAERIVSAGPGPLEDGELDGVSGGFNVEGASPIGMSKGSVLSFIKTFFGS